MNKEKLKDSWEKVKGTLGKVSKKIWILIAVAIALAIAGIILFYWTRPYATLITGATSEEIATVRNWLQDQGVSDYRMDGSDTILVPSGQAATLKARLLQEQYSSTSSGFSGYFERVGALTTNQQGDRAWLVALQEDMEATIRRFEGVHDADVTINLGEDRRYVLDSNNRVDATASVFLTMEQGKLLDNNKAAAIRNYVSHGVAGLDVNNVSITDSKGNIYDSFSGGGMGASDASALKLQMEQYWSNFYRAQIEQALERTYGPGNYSVIVHCDVSVGDKTVNDYQVHLPEFAQKGETNGAGIIGKHTYVYQFRVGDDYTVGGVVGTTSNADLPTYVEEGENLGDVINRLLGEGTVDYDNSKTQTTMVITAATLEDITASISINSREVELIDLDQVTHYVATATGIQAPLNLPDGVTEADYLSRKISILFTPFYQAPVEPGPDDPVQPGILNIPIWVLIAAGAGLLVFIILLTVILLLRRRRRRKQQAEQEAVEQLLSVTMASPGASGPDESPVVDADGRPAGGADVMNLHTERSMELRQSIRDFVDENMEVAALLIKSMLKEDGGGNG